MEDGREGRLMAIKQGPADKSPQVKPIQAEPAKDRHLHSAESPLGLLRWRIDWRAYFRRFCELHGEPMEHEGRLLFPDAWTYSLTDHAGPEWEPPADPARVKAMRLAYQRLRLARIEGELEELGNASESLKAMTMSRSAPVMVRRIGPRGAKRSEGAAEEANLDAVQARMDWLREQTVTCRSAVQEIEGGA